MLLVKVVAGVFTFPICAILITQSSPSRELLGTINGANQALGSLCRAIGPAIAGVMFTRSLEISKPWIVWRVGLGVIGIVVWIGCWFISDEIRLPNPKGYMPVGDSDPDEAIEEEIEDRSRRQEEDRMIRAYGPICGKQTKTISTGGETTHSDELESDDEDLVQGVSKHFLSNEH